MINPHNQTTLLGSKNIQKKNSHNISRAIGWTICQCQSGELRVRSSLYAKIKVLIYDLSSLT